MHRRIRVALHVTAGERFAERRIKHRWAITVDQSGAIEFAEDGHDAAGAMHVLHVVFLGRRRHLGEAGHAPGDAVDVLHGERHLRLLRGGK